MFSLMFTILMVAWMAFNLMGNYDRADIMGIMAALFAIASSIEVLGNKFSNK